MLALSYTGDLYVPSEKTSVDKDFYNKRFKALYDALVAMDAVVSSYGQAEATLVQLGLVRLNETLGPLLTKLQEASELGFLVARSVESHSLVLGEAIGWTITEGQDLFTPTPYLLAQDDTDETNWGLLSLDSGGWTPPQPNHVPPITTGELATHVVYASKTQSSGQWTISANSAALPVVMDALEDVTTIRDEVQVINTSIQGLYTQIQALWELIQDGPVSSVNGQVGDVVLAVADIVGLTTALAGKASVSQLDAKQNASSKLTALAALTWSADKIPYFTGASTLIAKDPNELISVYDGGTF